MPANLSFRGRSSIAAFYTSIHRTIADHATKKDLPPTAREFADWLCSYCPGNTSRLSVLDAGCGLSTLNTQSLLSCGFGNVIAIDSNPDAVSVFRNKNGDSVRSPSFGLGSILELPFAADTFDLIACTGVVHHTIDPHRAMEELARVLKHDGVLYLSVYAFRGSLFDGFIRLIRLVAHAIPFPIAYRAISKFRAANNFFLDHAYVPILWLFHAEEVRSWCATLRLTIINEFPTGFDVFARRRFGRLFTGDGLMRVFVCRKLSVPVQEIRSVE